MQLSEYQNVVNGPLEELAPLVQKYGAPDSPLGEKASHLESDFKHAKRHCAEQLASGRPRIMLYGLYNSGKSTLLNALMGEVRASMADVPTTDRVDRYEWQGYELLDTPGINAPKEHEEISKNQLKECQVILFVVSANGTFESKAVSEAMRDVILSGKRLFIILNDKQGMGESDSTAILQAVQQNLINVGLPPEKAAEFTPCMVNARWALEGRLGKDEELVRASGIRMLETQIFEEIKRVNGFHIAADLCGYLSRDMLKPFIDDLREVLKNQDTNALLNWSLHLRKDYRELCDGLKSRIESACYSLPDRLMTCFPDVNDREALKSLNIKNIKNKINEVCQSYAGSIQKDLLLDMGSYRDRLSRQLAETAGSPKLSDEQVRELERILEKIQSMDLKSTGSCGFVMGPPIVELPGSILITLWELLKDVLDQLPIPTLLKKLAKELAEWVIGRPDDDNRKQAEQEAEMRNKAEEQYAQKLALWLQQLDSLCRVLSREFVQKIQETFREICKNTFEPLLQQVEAEIREKDSLSKSMQTDVLKLDEIRHRLDTAAAELQASA